jgi:hypothetical protein
MGPWERVKAAFGLLSVAAMLLLLSPGVRAVRAAGPEAAAPAAQSQCSATSRSPADPEVQAFIAELQREQLQRAATLPPGDGGIVVLNNRGYNYGPPAGIELDTIRAEAAGAARR